MKIRVIAIGKIKDDYLKIGISQYLTRLKGYADISIVELKDESVKENPNESEIKKVKEIECQRVLNLLKPNDFVVNLDLNQKQLKSECFAEFIAQNMAKHNSYITFVIGGSYGLSEQMKSRANDSISLSEMTFLHGVTRLLLLEQIYRSYKILNNETYHK